MLWSQASIHLTPRKPSCKGKAMVHGISVLCLLFSAVTFYPRSMANTLGDTLIAKCWTAHLHISSWRVPHRILIQGGYWGAQNRYPQDSDSGSPGTALPRALALPTSEPIVREEEPSCVRHPRTSQIVSQRQEPRHPGCGKAKLIKRDPPLSVRTLQTPRFWRTWVGAL